MHSSRQAEGREWSGGDGSGVEWRGWEGMGGQGRAGQGAQLLRWTFTGRDFIPLNTPWNGQPPSYYCVKRDVKKAGEEGDWKKKTQDRVGWKRLADEAVKKLQASPHT